MQRGDFVQFYDEDNNNHYGAILNMNETDEQITIQKYIENIEDYLFEGEDSEIEKMRKQKHFIVDKQNVTKVVIFLFLHPFCQSYGIKYLIRAELL
jgi:hypothetical protein